MSIPIRVSCYNNPWQVDNCLRAIRKFTDKAFIYVFDDKSLPDKLREIEKTCGENLAVLRHNKTPRGWTGKPASKLLVPQLEEMLNLAALTGADKVIKMDSDTLVMRPGLEEIFHSFKGDVGGTLERGHVSCRLERHLWGLSPEPNHHVQGGCYIASVKIIKKILHHHSKTGILDKIDAHEDVMMTAAVYGCGGVVVDIPEIQAQWRQHLWKQCKVAPIVLHPVKNEEDMRRAVKFSRENR